MSVILIRLRIIGLFAWSMDILYVHEYNVDAMILDGKFCQKCSFVLYRVAQKERNTYHQLFQENEGQNNQVVCIIAYKILFPVRWHQDH